MTRRAPFETLAAALGASVGLAAADARGQDFLGDTVTLEVLGSELDNTTATTVVGPGAEFVVTGRDGFWTVDITGSRIEIRATLDVANSSWGTTLGGDLLGALVISDLDFSNGDSIAGVTFTGGGSRDPDDVALVDEGIRIGSFNLLNLLGWTNNTVVRIDVLPDDCPGPEVINARTGIWYQSLADAISDAQPGDTLELAPCTFGENLIEIDKDLTLRGRGPGRSVIDGGSRLGRLLSVTGGAEVSIESIALRRGNFGISTDPNAPLSVDGGSSAVFLNCVFERNGNPNANYSNLVVAGGSAARVERSVFRDMISRGSTIAVAGFAVENSRLTVVNSLIDNIGVGNTAFQSLDTSLLKIVNCTFVNNDVTIIIRDSAVPPALVASNIFDRGDVFLSALNQFDGFRGNVFPGAEPGNIDAAPLFVDPANVDYRLAAGSPGIDAADAEAYDIVRGGLVDLEGALRASDDPGLPDSGTGLVRFLDAGAYEFQGLTLGPADGDFNRDNLVDFFDIIDLAALIQASGS